MAIKFKRILWLQPGPNEYFGSESKGLKMLGADVLLINYREETLRFGISGARKSILKILEDFSPDLVLVMFFLNSYELSPEYLRRISSKVPLVVHAGDDELYSTWQTVYFAQSADALLTGDYGGRLFYEQMSLPTVYYRSSIINFEFPLLEIKKTINVSYIGDCTKADRSDFIRYLRENGIEVVTYGHGSENGFVSRQEFLRIISASKINLNFVKRDVPPQILKREPWRKYFTHLSGRAYEAARMKSFCLSEFCQDLEEILSIGDEVDCFHNKEELLKKVKYYLKNDAEREAIAINSFKKVKSGLGDLERRSHTYSLLYEKLQSSKGEVKSRPIFRSSDFNTSEVKGNFFIFIKLLLLGRFTLAVGVLPYFIRLNRSCLVGLWYGVTELVSWKSLNRK